MLPVGIPTRALHTPGQKRDCLKVASIVDGTIVIVEMSHSRPTHFFFVQSLAVGIVRSDRTRWKGVYRRLGMVAH